MKFANAHNAHWFRTVAEVLLRSAQVGPRRQRPTVSIRACGTIRLFGPAASVAAEIILKYSLNLWKMDFRYASMIGLSGADSAAQCLK